MELLERVSRSTCWAFIKDLLALYIWVDVITDYMVVHTWKVLCDDEMLNCIYWKLGLTFCLLPSLVFITSGILLAWWIGGLDVFTGLSIIACGAFYLITFPLVKLCAIVFSLVRRCIGKSTKFQFLFHNESDFHVATKAIGVFEAVFESLPQVSIKNQYCFGKIVLCHD